MNTFLFGAGNTFIRIIAQFFSCLLNVFNSQMFVIQFAGIHSFFPVLISKLFGKKSVIFLGGTDCVSFPAIKYGNFSKTGQAFFTRLSVKWCTHLIATNENLIDNNYTYLPEFKSKQGLKHFVPGAEKKYTVIKFGFDAEVWKNISLTKKQNSFISIATDFSSEACFVLKGIDLIVKMAEKFPDYSFTLIGGENKRILPKNIKTFGWLERNEIIKELSQHQFYFQLSVSEGFSNTLCEAMLCECVPIVSNVFLMPEIVGDTGFVLKEKNETQLIKIIEELKGKDSLNLGKAARKRITEILPPGKREVQIIETLEKVLT